MVSADRAALDVRAQEKDLVAAAADHGGLEGGGSDVDQRHRGAIVHGVRAGVVDGGGDEVREQLQGAVAGDHRADGVGERRDLLGVQCVGWVSVTRCGGSPRLSVTWVSTLWTMVARTASAG